MDWNPRLVLYVCVAKGASVLAEYSSSSPVVIGDGAEEETTVVARKCLERTPPRHSSFSQTVRNRSYTFLIDESLTYFVISHEELGVSESLRFLERVKEAFQIIRDGTVNGSKISDGAFQKRMSPVFWELLQPETGTDEWSSVSSPSKIISKKKRIFGGGENASHSSGNRLDVAHKRLTTTEKEFSVPMMQSASFGGGDEKQKVKQIWRMHVWVVLVLDLVVCAVLLGIWLKVCGGFRCIDG